LFIKLLIALLGIRDLHKRVGMSYEQIADNGVNALRYEIELLLEDTPEGRKAIRFVQQRQASGEYSGLEGDRLRIAMQTDMEFVKIMVHHKKV
jgi:hypothetical protein